MNFCDLWLCTDQPGLLGNTECVIHSDYSLTPASPQTLGGKTNKQTQTVINYDNMELNLMTKVKWKL